MAVQEGRVEEAASLLEESLTVARAEGTPSIIYEALYGLALSAAATGAVERAEALQTEALQLERQQGDAWYMHLSWSHLATLALRRDDLKTARERLEESMAMA